MPATEKLKENANAPLLGNRSLRCSTSCIHAVVRIMRSRHSYIHVHHANKRE